MDLIKFTSPGTDRFGRKYPIKIKFNNGTIIFGHIVKSQIFRDKNGEMTTKEILFKTIRDIDNWIINKDEDNRESLEFDDSLIEEISNFTDY